MLPPSREVDTILQQIAPSGIFRRGSGPSTRGRAESTGIHCATLAGTAQVRLNADGPWLSFGHVAETRAN
jgi:hypothetical protein